MLIVGELLILGVHLVLVGSQFNLRLVQSNNNATSILDSVEKKFSPFLPQCFNKLPTSGITESSLSCEGFLVNSSFVAFIKLRDKYLTSDDVGYESTTTETSASSINVVNN